MEQQKPVDEQVIIDQIFKERDTYQETNSDQREAINEIFSSYMGKMEDVKKVPYFEPITIPKLRTEISYIVPFIFSGSPEIEVEGVGEEDKTISSILEKIVNFRLDTIPQAYERIEAWVKQSVTFGTSLLKVNWKFTTKTAADPQTGQNFETVDKDEPELEVPNILDCFYNPIIPEIEQQSSIIFRSVIPVEDVKNNPIYDFTDTVGNLNREKVKSKDNATESNYDSTSQLSTSDINVKKATEGTVEIYERITKDRIQTVADGAERLVLRDKPWDYGFINAVKLIHEPNSVPNRFDGLGVGQNTLGLSKGYYSIINQTKQNITLANNPMFMGRKGARIDSRQLVSKPGGFISVDGDGPLQDNIQQVQMNDIKQGAMEFINKLDDEHKRASGANDLMQGAASNKTLGQDQLASTYSSNRFELINRRFKQALADVANMLIKMELKSLQSPESPILRIFPQEVRTQVYQLLINESQDVKYNISVKGDTTIAKNKDIQIKQLIDAYNIFGAILPPENQMAWARKILELRGVDELDQLVPDPQVYAQQMQQQQMMQQAMNPQEMPEPGSLNTNPYQG